MLRRRQPFAVVASDKSSVGLVWTNGDPSRRTPVYWFSLATGWGQKPLDDCRIESGDLQRLRNCAQAAGLRFQVRVATETVGGVIRPKRVIDSRGAQI
jgi:hypothetical protein